MPWVLLFFHCAPQTFSFFSRKGSGNWTSSHYCLFSLPSNDSVMPYPIQQRSIHYIWIVSEKN
jgi:hypothetical protein